MLKLRRPYLLMLMLGLIPALAGCGDLLDLDINTDPDAATEISGDLLIPTALVDIGSNRTIEIGHDHGPDLEHLGESTTRPVARS